MPEDVRVAFSEAIAEAQAAWRSGRCDDNEWRAYSRGKRRAYETVGWTNPDWWDAFLHFLQDALGI